MVRGGKGIVVRGGRDCGERWGMVVRGGRDCGERWRG